MSGAERGGPTSAIYPAHCCECRALSSPRPLGVIPPDWVRLYGYYFCSICAVQISENAADDVVTAERQEARHVRHLQDDGTRGHTNVSTGEWTELPSRAEVQWDEHAERGER